MILKDSPSGLVGAKELMEDSLVSDPDAVAAAVDGSASPADFSAI